VHACAPRPHFVSATGPACPRWLTDHVPYPLCSCLAALRRSQAARPWVLPRKIADSSRNAELSALADSRQPARQRAHAARTEPDRRGPAGCARLAPQARRTARASVTSGRPGRGLLRCARARWRASAACRARAAAPARTCAARAGTPRTRSWPGPRAGRPPAAPARVGLGLTAMRAPWRAGGRLAHRSCSPHGASTAQTGCAHCSPGPGGAARRRRGDCYERGPADHGDQVTPSASRHGLLLERPPGGHQVLSKSGAGRRAGLRDACRQASRAQPHLPCCGR